MKVEKLQGERWYSTKADEHSITTTVHLNGKVVTVVVYNDGNIVTTTKKPP